MGIAWGIGKLVGDNEASPINVEVPGKTKTEKELIALQKQILEQQIAAQNSPTEIALRQQQTDYYNKMMADETLSTEEEAEFDREYQLQLAALNEQFGMETKEAGGKQMADLVARGVFDSTTGRDTIAKSQGDYASELAKQISAMGQQKEYAKYDMSLAKRGLAQTGYELTSGIIQSNMNTALQAAMSAENYYAGRGGLEANAALQNALATQARNQAEYKNRMGMWSAMMGTGQSLVKQGATSGG